MVAQNKTWGRAFLGETIVAINPDLMAPRAAKLPIILFSSLAALRKKRFLSFITDLNNAKDTVFNLKDPAPIFGQQLCSIELMCLSMKWRVHPKNAYTFDLEWNGQSEFECE